MADMIKSKLVRKWMEENQNLHRCGCGCGEVIVVKLHHHSRGIPKFINGHTSRVNNPMKGRNLDKNPHYKGGRYVGKDGYVFVLVPGKRPFQYVFEHRMVVEKHLGRKLRRDECVHHKNRIKSDNRIENLEIMTLSEHSSHHAKRGESGFAHNGYYGNEESRKRRNRHA